MHVIPEGESETSEELDTVTFAVGADFVSGCLQFARQFSRDEPLTFDWVCRHVNWPLAAPKNIKDLVHLEAVHDVLDLYLWLR